MSGTVTPGDHDVLLIVDVQNDFCPGGALAVPGGDEIVPVVNRLARSFANVVMTQDWHPPGHQSFASAHPGKAPFETVQAPYGEQVLWPDHCVQGTPGAGFHGDLDVPGAQLIVRKGFRAHIDSYSAFFENDRTTPTGLSGYLRTRGVTRVFVCGLATDFCVQYSARDARAEGFATILVTDACRAIDRAGSGDRAMAAMRDAGAAMSVSSDIAADYP